MGSRYGGLKQVDAVGPSGETILDYSVFDAIRAGFGKVVFVIRKDIEEDIKKSFGNKFSSRIPVSFAFQELDMLPEGFELPASRVKPWGTGHAVWVAKEHIDGPFCVINADDFYGANSYEKMATYLNENSEGYAMCGYHLNKTLSDHGSVSRGICQADEDGNLLDIIERTKISRQADGKIYHEDESEKVSLKEDETTSMNLFGFSNKIFDYLDDYFVNFLKEKIDVPKSEFYIPTPVNFLTKANIIKLKVLKTDSDWFGVTYKEDKPIVMANIQKLVEQGDYPENLWA